MSRWRRLSVADQITAVTVGAYVVVRTSRILRAYLKTRSVRKRRSTVIEIQDEALLTADWERWEKGPVVRVLRTTEELQEYGEALEGQIQRAREVMNWTDADFDRQFRRDNDGKSFREALNDPNHNWKL